MREILCGKKFSMDHGWSWIICGAAFIVHALTSGFSFSIGVYYAEFLYVFIESKATTAWISSLNLGTFCGVGRGVQFSLIISVH